MTTKSVDELVAGDVLGEAVTNRQGAMLIPAETVLKESHFRLLRMWGIESVSVSEGAAKGPDASHPQAQYVRRAERQIRQCLGAGPDNEIMAEILGVAAQLRAARMAAEEAA